MIFVAVILFLVLITAAFMHTSKSQTTEHFAWIPRGGSGVWGQSPPCTERASGFQEDKDVPGRYWGWQDNASCAFYRFSNGLTPGFKAKVGNNGTVNCNTYCAGAWDGGPVNGCQGGWDTGARRPIDCNTVRGEGPDIQCFCMPSSGGAQHRTTTIDGKQYNICNNPGAASTTDSMGRRWGWESNMSCVVV